VRFTAASAVLLVTALLGALVLSNVFVAAHRVIGWGVASALVAVLLKPPIAWVSRFVPKVVALLLTGLALAGVAGVLVYAVFDDLQSQTQVLQREGPAAAARLEERTDRIGEAARDLRLTERAEDAFEALEVRFGVSTEVIASAAGTVPSYFVCFILTIFFVLYGTPIVEGAIDQIRDGRRRARVEEVVVEAIRKARTYIWASLLQGTVVGGLTFALADHLDLPAATVLALVAAVAATVPYIGIVVGVVPTVMLVAGLESPAAGGALITVAVAAQGVEALVVRRIVDRRSLHVGPAIPVIVGSIGLEVYGIGGALYGAALAVVALATADAAATEADEPLPTPNEDWVHDPEPEPEEDREPEVDAGAASGEHEPVADVVPGAAPAGVAPGARGPVVGSTAGSVSGGAGAPGGAEPVADETAGPASAEPAAPGGSEPAGPVFPEPAHRSAVLP
jgi:predicted PurR-regulated permease PerM